MSVFLLAGISMHKGYAFVQFANAFDARSACLGEDKRVVLGQTLDVNLVSEPKAHQTGRKRQNITKTGNDWDYYYDSYYASVGLSAGPPPQQRLAPPPGPPHKRARLMVPLARPVPPPGPPGSPGLKHAPPLNGHPLNGHLLNGGPPVAHLQPHAPGPGPASPPLNGHHPATINVFSNPDILICGNCREMYTDLQELLSHKKAHCKLRFACKCHTLPEGKSNHEATLLCSSCRASFSSAWDLMVHVQAAHMLNIYQLGVPEGAQHDGAPEGAHDAGDLEPRSPISPAGSGRQSPSSETPPKSQQLAAITGPQLLQQSPQPLPQLQPQLLQQVDQTLSLTAPQLSPQPNQTNQQPLQQQQQPPQLASERLQCPAPDTNTASPSAFSEPDEATTPIPDVAVASPAASTSSELEAGVVVASLASLVGATLQCNLKAEPLKSEDEVLLAPSPEPQSKTAWEAQQV
ncbi:ATP-dependent helicase brm-like isoform X2 [Frankliniella occidentalis]|uniref:ATP-dependent helicase brm-like isoform X2 n=1 Tax=Frankliniella occidentalis TaxID=133901 RepID=A0A9C6WWX6_FRAOC|nr:ATP-dependent helicase brm-like isoform X2 [Frankliniella occidentalis]